MNARPDERSRLIASYLGPTAIVVAASEALNLRIWAVGSPPLTYLAGLVWFLGGLAVVRIHPRWAMSWTATITLLGWFFLLGGLFRLFLPEAQQGNQNTPAVAIYAIDAVLITLGAVMSAKAYWPRGAARSIQG
jgi:hypothetical protein